MVGDFPPNNKKSGGFKGCFMMFQWFSKTFQDSQMVRQVCMDED